MDGRVDWLSWTVPCNSEPRTPKQAFYIAKNMSERLSPDVSKKFFNTGAYSEKAGRAPYRYQMVNDSTGFRVFGGGSTNTVLCEASGKSCDAIRDENLSRGIVGQLSDRLTRLDYAVDVRTGDVPSTVLDNMLHDRFRSRSIITSDSGQTVYIGSPRSDRFARVYRYNPPHPRSELLRFEFVFRRKMAKSAGKHYASEKTRLSFAWACAATFGFDFAGWGKGYLGETILSTPERSEHEGKTVTWLYKQVAPAVARCLQEDALNLTDWLEHVYSL